MKREKSFAANADTLPALSDHYSEVAPDLVTTLYINYEWRRLISDALQSYADSIIRNLDDSLVDDYRNKFQVLLDDLYDTNQVEGYRARVLATNPIRYNPLGEGAGLNMVDISPSNHTGSYVGVTWDGTLSPTGEKAVYFDGVNDGGQLLSSAFAAAVNMNEGSFLLWLNVDASSWTDGVTRGVINFSPDASNSVGINKPATPNNSLFFIRRAGGNLRTFSFTSVPSGWLAILVSWSVTANEWRMWANGTLISSQIANTSTNSGLVSAVIGSGATIPSAVLKGYESTLVVWNTPADSAKLALMTP